MDCGEGGGEEEGILSIFFLKFLGVSYLPETILRADKPFNILLEILMGIPWRLAFALIDDFQYSS